jgi:thioredoxin 1
MDELTREHIQEWVLEAEGPVFIDVWGTQCMPCLALAPTYEDLASRYRGVGRFLKLEAPKNRMACVDLRVMGMPTFLLFLDGAERSRLSGESVSPSGLTEWVESGLSMSEGGET